MSKNNNNGEVTYAQARVLMQRLGHPVRLDILLAAQDGGSISPKGFVDVHDGITLGAAAYHFRKLHSDRLIKLSNERRVRGAVEHFYAISAAGQRALKV